MKRSPLKRRVGLKTRRKPVVRAAREAWDTGGTVVCQNIVCREADGFLHRHHVSYAQEVRRVNGDLWDTRNRLMLCAKCHQAHHAGGPGRLLLASLTDENILFCSDLLGPNAAYEYLRRRYRGHDHRVEALLEEQAA